MPDASIIVFVNVTPFGFLLVVISFELESGCDLVNLRFLDDEFKGDNL
jgi:hypothetical protein